MSITTATFITATIKDGEIVLPPGVNLPNGTIVRIHQVKQETELQESKLQNLRELLKDYEGIANDLPADMAENHDHYIHGHPKK